MTCRVPADWFADVSLCWFEWQSLLGGMLAVVAALIGATLLNRQIQQAEKHRQDEIARRHVAARLTMPLALAGLSEMNQKIADAIAEQLETFDPDDSARSLESIINGSALKGSFDRVEFPPDAEGSFEKFVETLTIESGIKHVSELIGQMQILLARFNGFKLDGAGAKLGLESLLLDAATVRLLIDKMFDYARNVDSNEFGIVGVLSSQDAWNLIRGKAQSLVFARQSPDRFFPAINQLVDRYIEAEQSPWLEKFDS